MPATRKQSLFATKKKPASSGQCSGGIGWGRNKSEPHQILLQCSYNDFSRGLRRVKITLAEAKAAYTCRKCGEWQGCGSCLEDISNLVCQQCRDWANDLSEQTHGKMVKNLEMRHEAMKLVVMVERGQINRDEYKKLWDQLRGVYAK